jgi:hypothetical protein
MEKFIDLVVAGGKALLELIPLWVRSSDEEREQLYQRTKVRVEGLRGEFTAADARDAANTQRVDDALKGGA